MLVLNAVVDDDAMADKHSSLLTGTPTEVAMP
jgi:hypothetical protein